MFIDTYLVEKQARTQDYELLPVQRKILEEIDSRQGVESFVEIKADIIPVLKNKLFAFIQASHRGTIAVEYTNTYGVAYKYILEDFWAKEQFNHNVFMLSSGVVASQFRTDSKLHRLREEVEARNKFILYINIL